MQFIEREITYTMEEAVEYPSLRHLLLSKGFPVAPFTGKIDWTKVDNIRETFDDKTYEFSVKWTELDDN